MCIIHLIIGFYLCFSCISNDAINVFVAWEYNDIYRSYFESVFLYVLRYLCQGR